MKMVYVGLPAATSDEILHEPLLNTEIFLVMSFTTFLLSLMASAFISATVLPGGSEALLAWGVARFSGEFWLIIAAASLANTLGALTTYAIGRLLPQKKKLDGRALGLLERFGCVFLLLSWAPVIGDALCAAAGWLRLSFWPSTLFILIGKFARYYLIAQATSAIVN